MSALTSLARVPRLILWGLLHLVFLVHGGKAVRAEGKTARLDGPGLRRHARLVTGAAVGLLSLLGLAFGNLGRMIAVFGLDSVFVLPVLILLAAAYRLSKPDWRWEPRWPCPHCRAEMKATDLCGGVVGAFFALRRCPSCAGLTTQTGAAAGPDMPAAGGLLKPCLSAAAVTWACALAGLYAAGTLWDRAGARSLAEAREQVRAARHSTEMPRQRPAPPDERNAVKLYEKAGEELTDAKTDDFSKLFLEHAARGTASAEETAAARRLVARYGGPLALLERGAARPQEHWGIDWDRRPTPNIKLPKYTSLFKLVRLLACRVALAAADGRTEAALKDVRLGLTLARSVQSEPWLLSLIIGSGMSNIMLDAAVPVLGRASLAQARREVAPLLSADGLTAGFRRALDVHNYGMTGWVGELSWPDASRALEGTGSETFPWVYRPFLKLDLASYHRGALELDAALDLPFPESKSAWEKAYERFQRSAWLYAQMAMPRFEPVHEKVLASQARQRLALASFAVRAFKEKEKRWPDGLWEVGPVTESDRTLQDPFTGGPFKLLRRQGGGLLIYSVGPDGVDDQGAPAGTDLKGDLTWRL